MHALHSYLHTAMNYLRSSSCPATCYHVLYSWPQYFCKKKKKKTILWDRNFPRRKSKVILASLSLVWFFDRARVLRTCGVCGFSSTWNSVLKCNDRLCVHINTRTVPAFPDRVVEWYTISTARKLIHGCQKDSSNLFNSDIFRRCPTPLYDEHLRVGLSKFWGITCWCFCCFETMQSHE